MTPCRKALESLLEHWAGLTRFVADLHPVGQQLLGASEPRPRLGPEELLRFRHIVEWAAGGNALFPVCHPEAVQHQRSQVADLVSESCAQNGGQVPADINPFLPWNMSKQTRRGMALDPDDSS